MLNLKIFLVLLCVLSIIAHTAPAQTLKVISYNIHHGADQNELNKLNDMGEYIRNSKADLVGLQEVDSVCNRSRNVDQMKELAQITGMHFAFIKHFDYDGGAYGLGVLSKHPIISQNNGKITSMKNGEKKTLAILSTQILLDNEKVVEFATVHFGLDQTTRLIQAEETLEFLSSDVPVILTGDFNAEPGVKELNILSEQFVMSDEGLENTFPVINPFKKIDFIWLSRGDFHKSSMVTVPLEINYSDHLPLEVEITLSSK